MSGNLASTTGFFNIDALSPADCGGGAPPSNAPCKNAGEQCWDDSECCQGERAARGHGLSRCRWRLAC